MVLAAAEIKVFELELEFELPQNILKFTPFPQHPPFCYASAFRRQRHYVFGLSVRPSVRLKPEILSFDLYMGPLVHPTNRNRFTACPSVCPSIRPSGEVSGHLPENAWRKWPEMLMYLDHLQNWLVYGRGLLIFSCDQTALQMVFSICLSVCPSVCPSVRPSHLFDYVPIIVSSWNFQELLPVTECDVHAKGQRSKVKVTEVTTQLNRFRTVTPVWIHNWWWNDTYSLIMLRRGALLFFKVIRQISRLHGSKDRRIRPRLGVAGL